MLISFRREAMTPKEKEEYLRQKRKEAAKKHQEKRLEQNKVCGNMHTLDDHRHENVIVTKCEFSSFTPLRSVLRTVS